MARKILPDGFIESSASNSVDKIFSALHSDILV